jgi:hypothetical protein
LGSLGLLPNAGVFEFEAYFFEAFFFLVVLKGTPSRSSYAPLGL